MIDYQIPIPKFTKIPKGEEKMKDKFNQFMKNESGITALETAIILIAFVVVAAIFAFTVLSTGTFLTERSKEAAYSGLQEVRGSMELKGSVVLLGTGDQITFNLAPVAGGSSVDLSKVKMTFRMTPTNQDLSYDGSTTTYPTAGTTWIAIDMNDASKTVAILTAGSLAKIVVHSGTVIAANQTFALEIKPPTGGVMQIERTAPAQITTVTDLH
jgi:flagellin FlaB